MSDYKSDIEIAREAKLRPIAEIAGKIGLNPGDLIAYGEHKAKIKMRSIQRLFAETPANGKLILVSAITPTPAGEGKTTTSIGLAEGFGKIGKKVALALREPSLGPCLGMKGGATGGGRAQVLPMEDINLHFTGDLHAVTAAHNLISAALDSHLHFSDLRGISSRKITWKRVLDMNDRALRDIVIGLGGAQNSVPRQSGFDITAASEVMAVLCLSLSYSELKEKIGNIVLGFTEENQPITVKQLKIEGAVATLLKDALLPNIVQTMEGNPAFIHGGPFANIAQGANSIMATKLAMHLSDYVITEAGFGFDLGAEKFFDIVCRYGNFHPATVVLVATARALKMHGGMPKTDLKTPNPEAVLAGRGNLEKHIENIRKFGVKPVVALNRFVTDTEEELEALALICREKGAAFARINSWEEGGRGATELARLVADVADANQVKFTPLYDWEMPVEKKIERIATEVYGASHVDFLPQAKKDLKIINEFGYNNLPICVAKTQNSLSDNPQLLGRPKDFLVTVREIIISAGAGFLVPLTGNIMRMPGLPRNPAAEGIDIDDAGNITGLS
ncbi:MAG: formate--tetrahydrofolate ligase [Calditrichae bacterium]|nr:formate--tetrahydrofolate ligase [Calditrichia bacterium]